MLNSNREGGANREKLTVIKIINNEMFFSPFMSLINREQLCVNRAKCQKGFFGCHTNRDFSVIVIVNNLGKIPMGAQKQGLGGNRFWKIGPFQG